MTPARRRDKMLREYYANKKNWPGDIRGKGTKESTWKKGKSIGMEKMPGAWRKGASLGGSRLTRGNQKLFPNNNVERWEH